MTSPTPVAPPLSLVTPHRAGVQRGRRARFAPPGKHMHPLEVELRALVRDPKLLDFFERATDGLWMWDLSETGGSFVTPAFGRAIGFEPGEFEQGSPFWESRCHPDDWSRAMGEVQHAIDTNGVYDCTTRMRHKDGHWVHSRSVGLILRDAQGIPYRGFGIHHNVTELIETRIQLEQTIRDLTTARDTLEKETRHDPLTDLLNRRGIEEALLRMLQQVQRLGCEAYAIVLDLDNFKAVNDRLGHAAGDQVLIDCAACVRGAVRVVDECGRLGGDEFVVFLLARDRREAEGVADRVKSDLAHCAIEFEGGDIEITLSAALGPIYSGDGPRIDRIDTLLKAASPYLQHAKSNGKNQISMQSVLPPPPKLPST